MNNIYSLGGGCYAAYSFQRLGYNKEHFFFDYMWNLQGGLKTVVDIFNEDFKSYYDISNYEFRNTHKILTMGSFNTNIVHPELVLMHHDTRVPGVFDSICRKADRTIHVFNSREHKLFIYYRGYFTGPETVSLLKEETEYFVTEFIKKYNTNFTILSLIEITPKELCCIEELLSPLISSDHILYDYIIRENNSSWDNTLTKHINALRSRGILS